MSSYDNRPLTLHGERKPGPRRVSFGPVGQRLAGVFRAGEDPELRPEGRRAAPWLPDERDAVTDEVARFPLARNGYDRQAVDQHVADLERELSDVDQEIAQLRSQARSTDEVATEIRRIGEQTSEVLITAHEQRGEILRVAREEADRRVSEAQGRARAVTQEAETRLRGLEVQNQAALRERDRLLEDLRTVSEALATVVDSVQEGIPEKESGASTAADATTEFDAPTRLDPTRRTEPPPEPGPLLAG